MQSWIQIPCFFFFLGFNTEIFVTATVMGPELEPSALEPETPLHWSKHRVEMGSHVMLTHVTKVETL